MHIHCLYLLRETRTCLAPPMIVLYVCIERNSYFSLSFLFVFCCLYGNKKGEGEREKERKHNTLSIIWLVDFFFFFFFFSFASSFSSYFIVTCLQFFPSHSLEPVRRQATEKRKRLSNRKVEEEEEASYFFLQLRSVFFCSPSESKTQYILLSLSLPVLVCKSSSNYAHTHHQKTG